MNKKIHFLLLTSLTLLVMVVSALHPMIVRADDSTPSAPISPAAADTSVAPADTSVAPASTSVPPADTSVAPADTSVAPASTSVAPVDTSVAPADTSVPSTDTSVAPADASATSADTSVAPTDTSVAPTDTSTVVGAVPTGTPVVVLDATGTPVPLATQAAADIIKTGDPIWCPDGVVPVAGSNGCTSGPTGTGYGDLRSLINSAELAVVTGQNGTIWIQQGSDSSSGALAIAIDGNTLTNLRSHTLTLQGGWDGTASTTISSTTDFTKSIYITNWLNDVTLNDITFSSGTAANGLYVTTTGNIHIHHVISNNNKTGVGAFLDNRSGTGNIMVDSDSNGSSEFNTNTNGLVALSNGTITLIDVTADSNIYNGADLDNCDYHGSACTGTGGIIVDFNLSHNDFSGNKNYGLYAKSAGAITLNNVSADGNSYDGAYLDNTFSSGPSAISVKGSTFGWAGNGNVQNGLEVYSNGDVKLTNVAADYNTWDGALLGYNNNDDTFAEIGGNISVIGGDFSGNNLDGSGTNNGAGLEAYADGSISLSGVTANSNTGGNGAYLETFKAGEVIIDLSSGANVFDFNEGNGLEVIVGDCTISLTGVTADKNNADGAYLKNAAPGLNGDIEVTNSTFGDSTTGGNGSNGLEAYSNGNITLSGVTADGNHNTGADLANDYLGATGNISIDLTGGSSEFNNNTSNGEEDFGMVIDTYGNVTLNNVKANDNEAGDGTDIYDFSNLLIQNSFFNDNYSTIDTWGNGLFISSPINGESVVLNNVQTSGDGVLGDPLEVHADGTYVNIPGQLTIDPSQFDNNTPNSSGLEASAGNITITCSDLSNNDKYGVNANLSGGTLTLNGDTLSGNGSGAINLSGGTLVTNSVNCSHGGGKGTAPIVGGAGPLPWNTINVPDSGGQGHPLECTQYSGTELILPNHDHALLPCPIGAITGTSGSLSRVTSDKLPGALDSKFTFVSAVDAEVNPALTGGMMTVSFTIPSGKQGANFAILHWDGTKWVNLGGSINPPGFFSITTNLTGDFVLVTQ